MRRLRLEVEVDTKLGWGSKARTMPFSNELSMEYEAPFRYLPRFLTTSLHFSYRRCYANGRVDQLLLSDIALHHVEAILV